MDAATEASFLASARQSWSGAPDYRDLGARLEVARWLGPRVTAFAHASWHDRSYRTRTHLDGPVWDATLRGSWVVLPTVRADLSAGYAQQRPKSRRERHQGRWLGTGVTVALPLGFTVGGAAEMRWTDYEPGWFPFVADNGPREDRTRSFRISPPTTGRSRSQGSARNSRSSTRGATATPSSTTTAAPPENCASSGCSERFDRKLGAPPPPVNLLRIAGPHTKIAIRYLPSSGELDIPALLMA